MTAISRRKLAFYVGLALSGVFIASHIEWAMHAGSAVLSRLRALRDDIRYRMGSPIVELTDATLGKDPVERFPELTMRPAVVDIGYEACIPCKRLGKEIRKLPVRCPGVSFYSLDKVKEKHLLEILQQEGLIPESRFVPLLVFYNQEKIIDYHVGFYGRDMTLIEEKIRNTEKSRIESTADLRNGL